MNFQSLKSYLEDNCCVLDHMEGNLYWATNVINAHVCEIENLSDYSSIALCHYFFELGVPAPTSLKGHMDGYRDFRENVVQIPWEEKEEE